jgi:3-methyladenine DNA glycosylase Tag
VEAPAQITPTRLADYLEVMSKAVFQTGMTWRVVEAKWPGIREALREFDPSAVAGLGPDAIDELMQDMRVVRNRRKLEAIAENARTLLELDTEPDGFAGWLHAHGDFAATSKALQKRFRFLGELGAYYFLWVVKEPVPPHDEWRAARGMAPLPAGA